MKLKLRDKEPFACLVVEGIDDRSIDCELDELHGVWRLCPDSDLERENLLVSKKPKTDEDDVPHPDSLVQIFVRGQHGKSVLRVVWDDETIVAEGFEKPEQGKAELAKSFAGVVRLQFQNATLPIAIVPEHILPLGAKGNPVLERTHVDVAMKRLYAMVSDLASDVSVVESTLWSPEETPETPGTYIDPGTRAGEGNQGAPLGAQKESKELRSFYQAFRRLRHLLWKAGVVEAWQGLMADPVIRLENTYPVTTMSRARAPVVSGSRGPWALPNGWSPWQPDGDVRTRTVLRTGDTPPNRLAVGLARRILDALVELEAEVQEKYPHLGGSWGPFEHQRRAMRDAAQAVLACPVFAEVNRNAPVPLDSPSLQLNARCRPLLQAWACLDRPLRLPGDLPLDDVMLMPLAKTYELYERWCFVALCRALGATEPQKSDVLHRATPEDEGSYRVHVLASKTRGTEIKWEEEEKEEVPLREWGDYVTSWSKPRLPDGLILVEADNDELIAVAWDAKYRTLGTTDRWAAGYLYQAHAFRDALAVKLREEQRLSPVCWSIVLHPGPGIDKFVSQRPNDWPSEKKGGRTFELVDGKPPTKREDGKPRPGGVAMFALTPGHHTDPRDKVHLELLRAAVETAKRK